MPDQSNDRTVRYGATQPHDPNATLRDLAQRYDVLSEVGEGGMGIVYKARDRETGDTVALKVLKPEVARQPQLIDRFKRELLLARKITHKNVCRTYELLRLGDTVAIAMEYIEGESLREFLNRYETVPLRKGLEWISQVCGGLAEAHAQGIVHRDLKPENIVIDRKGQAKIMDFGIARSFEADATKTGTLIGRPAYMSPEQAEGKPPDARSDLYSLGLILYEMLTGQRAFEADTPVAVALKQIREAPPRPRELEASIPGYIENAIMSCLEKNPAHRIQSAVQLAATLGEPPPTEPEVLKPPELLPAPSTGWPVLRVAVLGVLVAAVVGAAVLLLRGGFKLATDSVKDVPGQVPTQSQSARPTRTQPTKPTQRSSSGAAKQTKPKLTLSEEKVVAAQAAEKTRAVAPEVEPAFSFPETGSLPPPQTERQVMSTPSPVEPISPQVVFSEVLNGTVSVGAGKRKMWTFLVDLSGKREAELLGDFRSAGGVTDNIRIQVFRGDRLLFDSGRVYKGQFQLPLKQSGQHWLVIDNTDSLVFRRTITGSFILRYVR